MRYPTLFAINNEKNNGWCAAFQTMDQWLNSFEKTVILTFLYTKYMTLTGGSMMKVRARERNPRMRNG